MERGRSFGSGLALLNVLLHRATVYRWVLRTDTLADVFLVVTLDLELASTSIAVVGVRSKGEGMLALLDFIACLAAIGSATLFLQGPERGAEYVLRSAGSCEVPI
jgi:hypothetical protein